MSKLKDVKKVVLAYSGGLDTSIILKWLQTELGAEVVTFTADLGQGDSDLEPARRKAEMMGAKQIYIEDVREEFVRDFVFPMFRANAQYEGLYLLGTSIARPLISKRLVEIARETGADAIAHGATGKGNDQVRFELSAYALNPDIKVMFAPYDEFAKGVKIAVDEAGKNKDIKIYSADISTADISAMREADSAWAATAATNPAVVGQVSVRTLAMLLAGEDPGHNVIVPPTLITQKDLNDQDIKNMEELGTKLPQFAHADVAMPAWMPKP